MTRPDPWLDGLNDAWRLSPIDGLWERVPPLPFGDRPCGRIDAAFRQASDLSDADVEATLEHESWLRSIGQ